MADISETPETITEEEYLELAKAEERVMERSLPRSLVASDVDPRYEYWAKQFACGRDE